MPFHGGIGYRDTLVGFEVLPRRWVVDRTLSWLMRNRGLARDYERLLEHSEAFVKWFMIGLMTRRLAPSSGRRPWQTETNGTDEPVPLSARMTMTSELGPQLTGELSAPVAVTRPELQ